VKGWEIVWAALSFSSFSFGIAARLACLENPRQSVCRAFDSGSSVFEDMGVDHGGTDIGVAEEFLDGADVGTGLEQVGCEGMTECVAGGLFWDSGSE